MGRQDLRGCHNFVPVPDREIVLRGRAYFDYVLKLASRGEDVSTTSQLCSATCRGAPKTIWSVKTHMFALLNSTKGGRFSISLTPLPSMR